MESCGAAINNNVTALEACKEYIDAIARMKKSNDIYKMVLAHIQYNESDCYKKLAIYCEQKITEMQKNGKNVPDDPCL